jgi:hypothetical protein
MGPLPGNPSPHPKRRVTLVLRLWAHGQVEPVWIGEVQDVSTGEVTHVQGLEALFDWLRQKTAQSLEASRENSKEIPGEQLHIK